MTKPHNVSCAARRLDAEQQGEWYRYYRIKRNHLPIEFLYIA